MTEMIVRKKGLLIALLLTCLHTFSSSGVKAQSIGDTLWSDVKASVYDAGTVFTGYDVNKYYNVTTWITIGGVIDLTAASVAFFDDHVRTSFKHDHNPTKDRFNDIGNLYGTGLPGGVLAAGLYGYGLFGDNPKVRIAGRHIVQSVAYSGIVTTILKDLIGRERPYMGNGPWQFHGPSLKADYASMPSGHTTVAFAISSSLSEDIHNTFATIGLYSLAALTGAARIYSDKHWLSDTFLGAAIGTACGYATAHAEELRAQNADHSSLLISPTINGFSLTYAF